MDDKQLAILRAVITLENRKQNAGSVPNEDRIMKFAKRDLTQRGLICSSILLSVAFERVVHNKYLLPEKIPYDTIYTLSDEARKIATRLEFNG